MDPIAATRPGTAAPPTAGARGIVTPEGVVLDLESAGIASRGLARAIDVAIQGALSLVVVLSIMLVADQLGAVAITLLIVGIAAVVLGYPIACETATRGRTPGKAALGLRVVTVEGAPIGGRHAFIRAAVGLVDFFIPVPGGGVAVVAALLSPRSQRLGDLAAGTIVLRERSAQPDVRPARFAPPPGWEPYAASLDVTGVTPSHYRVVRSFLLRAPELVPTARTRLASQIADPVARAMSYQPPPGTHPEPFLACVAARYQARRQATEASDG